MAEAPVAIGPTAMKSSAAFTQPLNDRRILTSPAVDVLKYNSLIYYAIRTPA